MVIQASGGGGQKSEPVILTHRQPDIARIFTKTFGRWKLVEKEPGFGDNCCAETTSIGVRHRRVGEEEKTLWRKEERNDCCSLRLVRPVIRVLGWRTHTHICTAHCVAKLGSL